MWPSDTAPVPASAPQDAPSAKGGFLASLLQSRHHDDVTLPPQSSTTLGQKIPVRGESDEQHTATANIWDTRVPPVHLAQQFPGSAPTPKLPLSALPIPQKPIVAPTPRPAPVLSPAPISGPSVLPTPLAPSVISAPKPLATPSSPIPTPPIPKPVPPKPSISAPSIFAPSPRPPAPPIMRAPTPVPSLPKEKVVTPFVPPVAEVKQNPVTPVSPLPPQPPKPTLVPVPRPKTVARPLERAPAQVVPATSSRSTVAHGDDDIGIDLGISEYLKGGPTFQIEHGGAPIVPQAPVRVPSSAQSAPLPLGGTWNPPKASPTEEPIARPSASLSPATTPTSIFSSPPPSTPSQSVPSQHTTTKPAQSNADLDVEKERLINERAQIVGAQSVMNERLLALIADKQDADNHIKPILLRETQLANEIDELERKEQGLTGELRRTIERDRWVKVEERRKVEQERMLAKRRLIDSESEIHAKEEEKVSLVKRGKDIEARIVWIDGEYKRREVRLKLAEVNQEKSKIESHRAILDNGLKRLKTSLEETEKNERRLVELKRSLAIKMPQNIAEEERFAAERFDLEKQMHEMETRRWSLEDELKHATELFAKEDMAYLDVMHRAEALEGELKSLG